MSPKGSRQGRVLRREIVSVAAFWSQVLSGALFLRLDFKLAKALLGLEFAAEIRLYQGLKMNARMKALIFKSATSHYGGRFPTQAPIQ